MQQSLFQECTGIVTFKYWYNLLLEKNRKKERTILINVQKAFEKNQAPAHD